MLRIYFLQQWYALADEALEDAIYDSQAMRTFAGIDLGVESVPDATTLLKFRHLLERHDLTRRIFEEVGALLSERRLLMREGAIVDATIIAAPSSTKNASKERDPEMHQTKKGNPVAFRNEGPHWRGCSIGTGAYHDGHGCKRGGHRTDPRLNSWSRKGGVRRCGLPWS
jgi:IS5 family transposase